MSNFWAKLPRPFLVQAPMEGVTDTVFRQIVARCGKPNVFFTEFTNVDALCSEDGRESALNRLKFTARETPIIAQIWGSSTKQNYMKSARIIQNLGFSGIDINLGCPEVVKQGAGGGLIGKNSLVKEIIIAVKEGAPRLPLSIKTRIGFDKIITEEWAEFLLLQNIQALTIHGRLVKEQRTGTSRWEEIQNVVIIRNKIKADAVIIGNGDVKNYADAVDKSKKYGVDGVMIGRALISNFWAFNPKIKIEDVSFSEKIKLLICHVKLFQKTWGKTRDINTLKKFFKAYVCGVPGASALRAKLMSLKTGEEMIKELEKIKNVF